jgi:hypothetical protein
MANRIGVAKAAPESATGEALSSGRADWAERSGRLYEELRSPSTRMIRRAFGRAFGDDEIEDIYGNAWLGTLRTLERRHAELSDEEIRRSSSRPSLITRARSFVAGAGSQPPRWRRWGRSRTSGRRLTITLPATTSVVSHAT